MDDFLVILIGGNEMVVGVNIVSFILYLFHKFSHRFAVFLGDKDRLGNNGCFIFHIDKSMRPFEVEIDFLLVQHVEDGDVVFAVAEVLERISKLLGVTEEIGEDDDQCALSHFLRDGMQ